MSFDAFEDIVRVGRHLEKQLGQTLDNVEGKRRRQPHSGMIENKNEIVLTIEVPGVNKEDIQLSVGENSVEIKAGRKEESNEIGEGAARMERRAQYFYTQIQLPKAIEADGARAKYREGLLEITLPKKKRAQIEIE